jgi:hypothetical protein
MIDGQTNINLPDLDIVGIGAICIALTAIWLIVRGLNKVVRVINLFRDDWFGTPGDENHEPTAGVLAQMHEMRISLINGEADRKTMGDDIALIKKQVDHELNRNSGTTTKDAAFDAKRISQQTMEVVQQIQMQQEEEVKERKAWADLYAADQEAARLRNAHVFNLVAELIGKEPSEQTKMWSGIEGTFINGETFTEDPDSIL